MKILVATKSVMDVELNIRVKDGAIDQDGLQYVMNAWDENAVEAAVVLKEEHDAEVTLVGMGDDSFNIVLRKGFAMGADSGILVDDEGLIGSDSAGYAKVLQKVYEQGPYDLVITGKQAQDTDSGQTAAMMAELTGLPYVANLVNIEVVDENNLKVTRQGDAGKEVTELQLPAVVTVNDSLNEPRLPALRGIMQAKKKKIDSQSLSDIGLEASEVGAAGAQSEVLEYLPPQSRAAGQKFEGDAAEITAQVVNLLSTEAKVI